MTMGIKKHRRYSHENARENARGDSREWGRCSTCLRDLFETVNNSFVIDFIKDIRFYSLQ